METAEPPGSRRGTVDRRDAHPYRCFALQGSSSMRLTLASTLLCCLAASALDVASPAVAQVQLAQVQLGPDCRPLPIPGYMMAPQPPDQACLRAQAQAAQAAESARRRQQAAAAAARERQQAELQQRMAALAAQCNAISVEQVRETVEQDPMIAGQPVKVLDVTAPQFTDGACRAQVLTTQGVLNGVLQYREFNGKNFLLARLTPERQAR